MKRYKVKLRANKEVYTIYLNAWHMDDAQFNAAEFLMRAYWYNITTVISVEEEYDIE